MSDTTKGSARVPRRCACEDGCKETTKRIFSPGHDARMVGRLQRLVVEGKLSLADAKAEAMKRGNSAILADKVERGAKEKLAKAQKAAQAKEQGVKAATALKAKASGKTKIHKVPSGVSQGAARR